MATPKQAHALTSYFTAAYKKHYGTAPVVNRYSARWGFDSVLIEMSEAEVKGLIDYYFETINPSGHTLDWFFYNYDKLILGKQTRDKDAKALAGIKEASRRRVEEWRKKNGNN